MFYIVDGGWAEWSEFAVCSSSCGEGNQKRSRKCVNPKPAHGGDECIGDSVESKDCKLRECPGKFVYVWNISLSRICLTFFKYRFSMSGVDENSI